MLAVGELVEVGFAGEDGSAVEEALGYPGVFCGRWIVLRRSVSRRW